MTTMPNIYWADLHNHNEIGYGKGSLERSYLLARNSLDVYALSVHGHWPDPPRDDPKLAAYHAAGFDAVNAEFRRVVAEANRRNEPGKFVAFIAYEWHSTAWGDYVVLFPGEVGELHRARTLDELRCFVREHQAIMIPHHVGYRPGWRGLDWTRFDPEISPLVEVFSEHGNSFERDGPGPMVQHSMGGVTASQTILERLKDGAHFGFTAGTDTHFGFPGSHGEGITGIYAQELTRLAIFRALKNRNTFAATGDRIEIGIEAHGAMPGALLPAKSRRRFAFQVDPLAPLDYIEVIKNGRRSKVWPASSDPAESVATDRRCLVRVEWGWGRMESGDETEWNIVLKVDQGEILRVISCLSGGEPAVDKLNVTHRVGKQVQVESFTSRRNPAPVNGIVLEIEAGRAARLSCRAHATTSGENGECVLDASLEQLCRDDVWGAPLARFSSPRIRLGRASAKSALRMAGVYEDPAPGPHDTYVFKARQMNGHTAWTSPYLFSEAGPEGLSPFTRARP